MIDSIEIATLLFDSTFQQKMGYDKETMACMFIPETYQVYWDMSAGRSVHAGIHRRRRDK